MPQDGKRRPKRESSTKKRLRLTFPHQLHGDVIYRVFFYWSTLKNDQLSDYIINPNEKVSEFPKGLALNHF